MNSMEMPELPFYLMSKIGTSLQILFYFVLKQNLKISLALIIQPSL